MQKNPKASPIKRTLPALVAGFGMTLFLAITVLFFGLNAYFNKNVATAQAASQTEPTVAVNQATVQELRRLVQEYQQREAQYQSEIQQAARQIDQLNQQNEQYRQLVQGLQDAGVIQITSDGQVLVARASRPRFEFEDDD